MRALVPAVLIALVVLAAACSAPAPDASAPSEPESRQDLRGLRCAGALDFPSGANKARADVDGDGRSDQVYLVVDRTAEPGCRALVVVDIQGRLQAGALDDSVISFEFGLPRLNSFAAIDSKPGVEIVVDLAQGASTSFVGIITLASGRLTMVRSGGLTGVHDNLFAYGGSVGHLDAVDCRVGLVMLSSAVAHARGYRVTRRFLDPHRPGWPLRSSLTEQTMIRPQQIGRFEEFSAPPFASC